MENKSLNELKEIAKELGVENIPKTKDKIIEKIKEKQSSIIQENKEEIKENINNSEKTYEDMLKEKEVLFEDIIKQLEKANKELEELEAIRIKQIDSENNFTRNTKLSLPVMVKGITAHDMASIVRVKKDINIILNRIKNRK